MWDLRPGAAAYLGDVPFAGRSVLEVGPASGFLSFTMESAGAAVTCLEPPMEHLWDVVPLPGFDTAAWRADFRRKIEGVRNAFWYAHHAKGSRVRMVEADPYAIPADVGQFDVGVLAAVLLHSRRPFDLMDSVARRVGRTMVVTEAYDAALGPEPLCRLLAHTGVRQVDTWWQFTPQFIVSSLALLGFPRARVALHEQLQPEHDRLVPMFTVVAERD